MSVHYIVQLDTVSGIASNRKKGALGRKHTVPHAILQQLLT